VQSGPRRADWTGRRDDSIGAAGIAGHESLPRRPRTGGGTTGPGVLPLTRDPTVPAPNNEAERALCPLKGQQKISGRVRSTAGARNPAVLRTVLDTARKQGWTRLEALRAPPDERIQRLEMS